MLTKLLIRYLATIGVVAHLVVLAAFIALPDLGGRLQDLARRDVPPPLPIAQVLATLPATSAGADPNDRTASGLPAWQADVSSALAPGQIRVDGREMPNLRKAAFKLKDGSVMELGPGVYASGMAIKANNVQVIGRGHVVFDGAAHAGKATFVVRGNNATIRNIECRQVSVADGNGACVRLAGSDLTLDHVYFHDAEQGILTGKQPGHVLIRDSHFENLGNEGRAHAIYHGLGGRLTIERSLIISARSEGHEVKSRALETRIRDSVIASLDGIDSRLIDVSNGGTLEVENSVLQQGPNSSNFDAIGFALEKNRHAQHSLTLRGNLIILEREGDNRLLHSRADGLQPQITDNTIVAAQDTGFSAGNRVFADRAAAGLAAYPQVPAGVGSN